MKSLNRIQHGKLIGVFVREALNGHLTADRDRLPDVQQLLHLAYDRTAFYHDKFSRLGLHPNDVHSWDDFAQVPTTTKDELIAAGTRCVVRDQLPRAFVSCSSGSSGKRFSVYQDAGFWIKDSLIGIAEFKKRFAYRATDLSLYANTSAYPFSSVGGRYRIAYFDNLLPASELTALIMRQKPSFLMLYPSIAEELMERIRTTHGEPPFTLKGIVTHSEQSTQPQRDAIGHFFHCPVYDEYATEELGRVAIQCREHAYHVIEAESYCEILDPTSDAPMETGEVGEVVGTCLVNAAMPLIRYRQGDLAAISPALCSCGLGGRVMDGLFGRKNDSFLLPDGRTLASGRLLDWTYQLFLSEDLDITQFQLTQTAIDRAVLRVVPGPGYRGVEDEARIQASFRQTFQMALQVDVDVVTAIAKTPAGKHLPIVSQLVHPRVAVPVTDRAETVLV